MNNSKEIVDEIEHPHVDGTPSYDDETIVWEGRPSQWVNLGSFIFWMLLALGSLVFLVLWNAGLNAGYSEFISTCILATVSVVLLTCALNIILPFLNTHFERTVITKNKIKESTGISNFFKEQKYCEISDIEDIRSPKAGILAVFGLSTLIILTNDQDQPVIKIRAIKDRDVLINKLLPIWRDLKVSRKGYFGGH